MQPAIARLQWLHSCHGGQFGAKTNGQLNPKSSGQFQRNLQDVKETQHENSTTESVKEK